MFLSEAMQLTQQALWLVLLLSSPAVLTAALVGLVIALIQASMQLQEQSFQYAAKFAAITVVLMLTAAMLGSSLLSYCDRIFSGFAGMVRS